ncbi:MAG: M23 family metallopeptidase [Clostridia bacterium]|nr:M23 family metallopeptidase [Clostridia bacterium]
MEKSKTITNIKLQTRKVQNEKKENATTQPIELAENENRWQIRFLQADRLVRNFAVAGALMLVVIAAKNSTTPEVQSVFNALKSSAGVEWDESIGKLSFVSQILPQEIQEVWNESPSVSVYAPVRGKTIHAWSADEPFLTIMGQTNHVYAAADGEVMSIAHGMNEEKIIRIRHDDGSEALYGNLEMCLPETGDRVYAGDIIAMLQEEMPLAFELRVNGRSVNPEGKWLTPDE